MICWWDEKANLGIYLHGHEFGTYSRPYGVIMGESPVENEWQAHEIDVCHGMNWDWGNMEYDCPPSQDVIKQYPATGNRPISIALRLPISEGEQIQSYLLSCGGE